MVTYEQFIVEFPEYSKLDPPLVQAKIADASLMFSEELFGKLYDQAVKYQAAILLASSPFGRPQKMTAARQTPYEMRLAEILASVPARGLLIRQ